MKRSYAIVGTGGVGGYFGGRLALAGHDVRFLLHSDFEYVREHGLSVKSHSGDFALPSVQAYSRVEDIGPVDVVVVCLKTTSEGMLSTMLPPLLKPTSLVILIQNGIGVEAEVERLVPGARLVAGLAFICSAKVGPGKIDHQFYGNINLAPYNLSPDDLTVLDEVAEEFRASGVPIKVMDYALARWKKAVWNMPFNGLSVLL
ncbi:MAG: 2-dehydropantoate 2-reductase N-terminal domain-containing protein, partial [Marinilabiliaceae bacterium]